MAGAFSTIQTFHSHSPRRRHVLAPIAAFMLMYSVLAHQAASATASRAHVSRAMSRMGTSNVNDLHKPRNKQFNVQGRKLQTLSWVVNTQSRCRNCRNHLYLLRILGTHAVESIGGTDNAGRTLVGSSPPTCVKKCGKCTPCRSVLVLVHTTNLPATSAEYYPEAWRCQCKGKTYNP